uniref:G_PROTEIN_RECEP_F1_2 domain-containing protein n=1 Tax=Parastrongyloides trichosuri TaxID=131310 RepID=A0A0N4ZPD6_PARTI
MSIKIIESIQLTYLVPSLLFMTFVGFIILYKILTKSKNFQNEFYPLVCYRTFNDILYHISILFTLKLPSWSIMQSLYLENQFIASLSYLFGATTCCVPFIHTLFISSLRYLAIYYPVKYKRISNRTTTFILLLLLFIISFGIGLPTLFFDSKYVYNDLTKTVSPVFTTHSVAYYQIGYAIVFYSITIIISVVCNISNFIGLWKNNKKNGRNKRSEILFALYCLFTLFTTCLMEAYLILRIGGNFFENQVMVIIANSNLIWIGDLSTLGDFYFLIIINSEVRFAIKEFFHKLIGKEITSSIKTTEIKSTQQSKVLRGGKVVS